MKKGFLAGMVLLAAGLAGCGSGKPANMYLEKTDSSAYSGDISGKENQGMYRYVVDDTVKTIHLNMYQLGEDGTWYSRRGQSSYVVEDAPEIAIGYHQMMEDLVLSDGSLGQYQGTFDKSDRYSHVSWLEGWTEIACEEEIPLTMQILDEQEKIMMPSLADYFAPEKLLEKDFDEVFVVTAQFSTTPLEAEEQKAVWHEIK